MTSLVGTCISLFFLGGIVSLAVLPLMPEIARIVPRETYAKAYSLFNIAFSCGVLIGVSITQTFRYLYTPLLTRLSFFLCIISLFVRLCHFFPLTQPIICGLIYDHVGWLWTMVTLSGTFAVSLPLIYIYKNEISAAAA